MAFIDARISEAVAPGFAGGPDWRTTLVTLDNGREVRNAEWLYPKMRYTSQYNFSQTAKDELLEWLFVARGMLHCFRYKDHADYEASNEPLTVANGTSTPVQLTKSYLRGGQSTTRLIQAPVSGTVTVYRNGVSVAGTLDATTGLFTPSSAWAADGLFTWTGEFDVWVRFGADYGAIIGNHPNHWTADVELVEVRR